MLLLHSIWLLILCQQIIFNHALEIPEHMRAHAKKLHNLCQRTTGVPIELMRPIDGVLPNDRTLQCYLHCLFDKVGLIDENHIVHLENIMEILPVESHGTVQNLVDLCGTQHGKDGCETAYLTVQCYLETDPNLKNKFDFVFD